MRDFYQKKYNKFINDLVAIHGDNPIRFKDMVNLYKTDPVAYPHPINFVQNTTFKVARNQYKLSVIPSEQEEMSALVALIKAEN